MARLHNHDGGDTPEGRAVAQRIRARRPSGQLSPLDGMILHSPPLADGWNSLLSAVRTSSHVSDRIREIIVLRVTALNRANYEWRTHEPIARRAGLDDDVIDTLRESTKPTNLDGIDHVVCAYVDAITLDIQVSDSVFDELKAYFDDREIVELTMTIAAYNFVTRFQEALQVGYDQTTEQTQRT